MNIENKLAITNRIRGAQALLTAMKIFEHTPVNSLFLIELFCIVFDNKPRRVLF